MVCRDDRLAGRGAVRFIDWGDKREGGWSWVMVRKFQGMCLVQFLPIPDLKVSLNGESGLNLGLGLGWGMDLGVFTQ